MKQGERVADRFVIEREAGAGGMGVVYRAVDTQTDRPVALKIMLHAGDEDSVARFLREARVLATLDHPRIVHYVDHGQLESGAPFLAMEWLEGEDLSRRLSRGKLSEDDAVRVVLRAAEALGDAHRRGLVHRDIKPSNLFLPAGELDRVTILDFGIARPASNATFLTGSGVALGTPAYMAPEQIRGVRDLDARVDVFALGCVLFECVAGRAPFLGEHGGAVLAKILTEEAPRLRRVAPDVARNLDGLVSRMLSREPNDRPMDGAAVALALASLGASAPPSSALGSGERRVISVIIARGDVPEALASSFGALYERRDNEVVIAMHGAGLPSEQASRAARCALAIRAASGAPLLIASGRADVADGGAAGDLVDRAVQMASRITTDAIRIDTLTAELLSGSFDVATDASGLLLKNERSARIDPKRLLGRSVQCVGRERDLSLLDGLLSEALSDGVARAAVVSAPPGMGKTRLLDEFVTRAGKGHEEVEIVVARGEVSSAGSPFGILARALRRRFAIADGDPEDTRRAKLVAGVIRDCGSAPHVADFLGEMIAAPAREPSTGVLAARADAMLMSDAIRAAWEDWLAARLAERPLLLVLEDLHFADVASVRFIDASLRNFEGKAWMVLATARPEVEQIFPNLWSERGTLNVSLAPLSEKAAEKLIRGTLPAATSELVAQIIARGGGNPFYLEELVRAASSGQDELPESLLGALQARIDALGPDVKRALRAASIFGERFWTGGVARLCDADVGATLATLEREEIAQPRATSRIAGEREHVFRHALVRETAYATLTDHDRPLGHRMAGLWLEENGESDSLLLARHFELGGEPARAHVYLRRAAEQALDAADLAGALDLAARAMATAPDDAARGALSLLRAEAHFYRGELADGGACGRSGIEQLARGSADWFRTIGLVATIEGQGGRNDAVAEVARLAEQEPGDDESVSAKVLALGRATSQLMIAGHPHAQELHRVVESLAIERALAPKALVWLHQLRAIAALRASDLQRSLEAMHARLAIDERLGDARGATLCRIGCGTGHVLLGETEEADRILASAIAAARRLGAGYLVLWAEYGQGKVAASRGNLELASTILASVIARTKSSPRIAVGAHLWLSVCALIAGDPARAEENTRRARELTTTPPMRAAASALLARALVALGRGSEAISLAEEADRISREVSGIEEFEGEVRLALAEALNAVGRHDEARVAIEQARARVLSIADRIPDATRRDTFLERVAANVRTLMLARQWTDNLASSNP